MGNMEKKGRKRKAYWMEDMHRSHSSCVNVPMILQSPFQASSSIST